MMQRSGEPSEASPPNLTGDWGGVRSYLERNGITFTLNYTNDFLANIGGGIKPGAIGLGVFQPQLDLDLEKPGGSIPTSDSLATLSIQCGAGKPWLK